MIYVLCNNDCHIFSTARAAAGWAEPIDIADGDYSRAFDHDGYPVRFDLAEYQPKPWLGVFRRRPAFAPRVEVLPDQPADPQALAELLIEAIRIWDIEPRDTQLAGLREQTRELWGVTR